jgi:benzoyl-CoA reductase/2-hydroxyglutaryl-CoA dehydratase subunit BcrC/BadD/HgdB
MRVIMPANSIGITTTVPVEILLAAGANPIDLNNIFISDPNPERLVRLAERHGFPLNTCTWIKGIYGICLEQHIDTVIGVTTGDCSNTLMLMEVLKIKGVKTIPFAYPAAPDTSEMQKALKALAEHFGTNLKQAEEIRRNLQPARNLAQELDRLTWQENQASGLENHYWLVSSSDFNQNAGKYADDLQKLTDECHTREPYPNKMLRLAFCGVPPVFARELYPFLEEYGGHVVFNEIQRQFAMPFSASSLAEQYTRYTYPYSIEERMRDIGDECRKREVDGIIHYVQAFCHRAIGDIVFRHYLKYPILTVEGNTEFGLSQHLKTRLEAYLDMLRQIKNSARQQQNAAKAKK